LLALLAMSFAFLELLLFFELKGRLCIVSCLFGPLGVGEQSTEKGLAAKPSLFGEEG